MSASRVVVYSTKHCGFCRRAEELLRRQSVSFDVIDVTHDRHARATLIERTNGRRTVPVIFVDDQPIGGYRELAAMVADGELSRRLAAAT